MHRCSNTQGNHICTSCGAGVGVGGFHHHHQTNSSFSMLFSIPPPPNHNNHNNKPYQQSTTTTDNYMYSSTSVDCTLSLGTPSTRLSNHHDHQKQQQRSTTSCITNLVSCDNLIPSSPASTHKTTGRAAGGTNNNDPLLARRCANCDTTSTPLWRNGPRGPKSLCNACGIRFKKEERRATNAAATTVAWPAPTQKYPCHSPAIGNEFRFIQEEEDDRDRDVGFLSWRLNVTDRPSLVHDFTR